MPSFLRVQPAGLAPFVMVASGSALVMASAGMPSPFYPALQAQIGFSPALLTVIFAIYAVTVLATLLIAGSLSDHLGRRPVLTAGFLILALFALLFGQAGSVSALLGTRALQGVACGVLLSTLSATTVDLEPVQAPGLAAICNSILPLLGLGAGALISGIALDVLPDAHRTVFDGLAVICLIFAALVWTLPETSPRHEGLWRALLPRVGIPAPARSSFWRIAPALFASWATGGLYLSLGGQIVAQVFGLHHAVEQGAIVALLAGAGAVACFLARRLSAPTTLRYGTLALAIGTALTLGAIGLHDLRLYLIALAIAGTGFGASFYGAVRSVAPLVEADERSELFAAIFTVSYLAFSVPAVLAGVLVQTFHLVGTATGYGCVVIVAALAAAVLQGRAAA
ncbi:MFS transporter [Paenirhodobacter populi]|uniref:MFS transporter n=1 Tax=Paenirhodobacter populi TaxID=2306993 RepID=A0A443JKK9_9RHOB|nr:MFS transporter [Sinirhodobacter populi]RWR21054.1 MFS transporter [Sinirhodobacter populi]